MMIVMIVKKDLLDEFDDVECEDVECDDGECEDVECDDAECFDPDAECDAPDADAECDDPECYDPYAECDDVECDDVECDECVEEDDVECDECVEEDYESEDYESEQFLQFEIHRISYTFFSTFLTLGILYNHHLIGSTLWSTLDEYTRERMHAWSVNTKGKGCMQ